MFHPVGQERVSAEIVHQIERLILEGVLRPGDRLPAERDLAGEFGVSR
ncbi:MAG: GntR family transcriptional regulator, partial [Pseudomonadota bacterium]